MAIAYRAGAAGNNGQNAVSASVPITIPVGAVAGDVAIATLFFNNSASQTMSSSPTGWNIISPSPINANNLLCWAYIHTILPGEPNTSATWTVNSTTRCVGVMDVFSGVDSVIPLNTSNTSTNTAGTTNRIAPAVTTTIDNTWIYNVWTARNGTGGAAAVVLPITHTAQSTSASAFPVAGVNVSLQSATLNTNPVVAGTYGTYIATYSVSSSYGNWSFALAPSNRKSLLLTGVGN